MAKTKLNAAQAHLDRGERLQARVQLAQVLADDPDNVEACHLLSTIDMEEGNFGAAQARIEKLLRTAPEFPQAIYNLGVCLIQAQRLEDAAQHFERALQLDPGHSGCMYNLAWLQRQSGNLDAAAAKFAALVKHNPNWLSAREALIETHIERGRAEDALFVAHETARRGLDSPRLSRLKGAAQLVLGQSADAEGSYLAAYSSDRNNPQTLIGLATAFKAQGKLNEAVPVYEKVLAESVRNQDAANFFDIALSELVVTCRSNVDWKRLRTYEQQAVARASTDSGSITPATLALFCDDPVVQKCAARNYWKRFPAPMRTKPVPKVATGPITIGWMSDDFGDHAGSYQLAALLEQRDPQKFRFIGFNTSLAVQSEIRRLLRNSFDDFRSLRVLSDELAVQTIRELELDLLVCSFQFNLNLRPALLSRKPAPVVVAYAGHPGTFGSEHVDYIIADAETINAGEGQNYDEAVIRMPTSARCILPAPAPTEGFGDRVSNGLRPDSFVFCNFSETHLIGPETFDTWMQILRGAPNSTLWLGESRHVVRASLRREASARGVDPERLVFGALSARDMHLARLRHADLYLDTLTFQEASPVHDALSAGLPVLSNAGRSFSARSGANLVIAAGMGSLVTSTISAYADTAQRLANNPEEVLDLKRNLRNQMTGLPVFRHELHFRNLLRAFELIVERNRNNQPVVSFDLPD